MSDKTAMVAVVSPPRKRGVPPGLVGGVGRVPFTPTSVGEDADRFANFANCKRGVVNCAFHPDCDSGLFSAADLCYGPARPLEKRTALRCVPLA